MSTPATSTKFPLGQTVITRGASEALSQADIQAGLLRHGQGNWGEVDEDDRAENELSLRQGFRVLSAYRASDGKRFWIITEADRSITTVLLPEEY